jgi:hypothetical protein
MRDSERLTPRLVKKWTASDQTESMMELRFDKTTRYVIISKRLTKGQRGEINAPFASIMNGCLLFLFILTTVVDFVSAQDDCRIVYDWQPTLSKITGCCGTTGIVCDGNSRITQL